MGMPQDMTQRKTLARVDDVRRRTHVEAARETIYIKNNTVDGTKVENILKEESLVPTTVCVVYYFISGCLW